MIAEARYNNNEEFEADKAESTTPTPQNRDANEAEMAPTMTTVNVNSLRQYRVKHEEVKVTTITTTKGALLDTGANGGMAGSDMKILIYHAQDRAHVTGIPGNMLLDLPIVTGAAFIETTDGPITGIFYQYTYYSKGKLIHSVPPLESYENQVMCTSRKKCGMQRVVT